VHSAGVTKVGRGFEHPGLVEGVPAHGRERGCNQMIFKVPSIPNHSVILYKSMIK